MNEQQADVITRAEEDYRWWYHQGDNRLRYAGQVIVLHQRELVGSGPDMNEAWEAAQRWFAERGRSFPDASELLCLPVPPTLDPDAETDQGAPLQDTPKD